MIGAGFMVGAATLSRLLAIGSISVLGRILGPSDFGVMAYAWLVIELQRVLSGLPFVNAFVRLPEIDQRHINTAFTICFTLNIVLAAILFFGADAIAFILRQPELSPVFMALAVVPLIDSVKNPRFVLLARELRFDWPAKVDVIGRLVTYCVSIVLAWILQDYWAMIIGMIAAAAVSSALTHYATPGPVGFGLRAWRDCVSFGAWTTAARVSFIANRHLAGLVLGSTLGLVSLGAFRMGTAVVGQIFDQLARPMDWLIFAGLAKKQRSVENLRRAYLDALGLFICALLPLGAGVALCAAEFLRVLLGPQWDAAVPVLQILAPSVSIGLLGAGARGTLNALGDVRSIFLREAAVLLFVLPAVWIGVSFFGLIGAAAATGAAEIFGLAVVLPIISRKLQSSVFEGFWQSWRSILSCLVMAAALLTSGALTGPVQVSSMTFADALVLLVLKATAGALIYAATHVLLWHLAGRPTGAETTIFSVLVRISNKILTKLGLKAANPKS